jgi:ATP-dependent Clp endopeptidase proteolytic subunit ClpP
VVDRRRLSRPNNSGAARPWFRIQNKADDATVAQIDIYDEIDWFWGVSAVDFRNDLKRLGDDVTTIDLHVNSPGGDVYEAIAIMNTLRQHDARVVTTIDGIAASSAGFIAVGASDELIMAPNSEIMAHLPWAIVVGDASDMRKTADDLDRIGNNIASIFADRAGGTVDEWMAVLTEETWWSAQEAVDAKLADRVLTKDAETKAKNRFDLSVFNHAGRSNAPAPRFPRARNQTPQPVEAEATEEGEEPTVATLSESALQKLGLDAEADEAAIEAAIGELADRAEKDDNDDTGQAPAEPTVDDVAKVAAKYGLTVVDKTVHDQLVADAAAGAEARAQQIREANEATVKAALADGQITPSSADTWRKSLAENRDGALALLATIPKNRAVPTGEIGHGVSRDDSPEDSEKAEVFSLVTGRNYGEGA